MHGVTIKFQRHFITHWRGNWVAPRYASDALENGKYFSHQPLKFVIYRESST